MTDKLWLSADEVLILATEAYPRASHDREVPAFCDGWKACQDRLRELLDDLMKQYTKDGRWDDTLSVWAYGKGFDAGLYHASLKAAAAMEGSVFEPLPPHAAKILDAAQKRIAELEAALATAREDGAQRDAALAKVAGLRSTIVRLRTERALKYAEGRNPTLGQVIINLMDVYGLPEPILTHPDTYEFAYAVEEKLNQLTVELEELRGIVTRVSSATYGSEAYPISSEDEQRMQELVKRWEKE